MSKLLVAQRGCKTYFLCMRQARDKNQTYCTLGGFSNQQLLNQAISLKNYFFLNFKHAYAEILC